jgi:hypothetical protein
MRRKNQRDEFRQWELLRLRMAASYVPTAISQKQKPTDCLLGACSGRQSVGYRFSLLTLLFSGVIDLI